jgi:ribonucleoside-diphosphate reductase alpha chain
MPRRRSGHTTAATIGGERFSFTADAREDGSLREVSVQWDEQGSAGAGLMETYAVALSVGLQHNVPLADLLRPALGLHFIPTGHTDDPEIPRARSVVDYFARRLAIDWLPYADRAALSVFTISELAGQSRLQWDGPFLPAARVIRLPASQPGAASLARHLSQAFQ